MQQDVNLLKITVHVIAVDVNLMALSDLAAGCQLAEQKKKEEKRHMS